MTVREAAPLWDDPRSVLLQAWSEGFDVTLEEFRHGHIITYEKERLAHVPYAKIWPEVSALRALLRHVGVGEEIESHYSTPLDRVKLTAEERIGLAPRIKAYIEYLEQEISGLNCRELPDEGDHPKDQLGPETLTLSRTDSYYPVKAPPPRNQVLTPTGNSRSRGCMGREISG